MTITEAMETAARGLDAVIEEELGVLAARGTAEGRDFDRVRAPR